MLNQPAPKKINAIVAIGSNLGDRHEFLLHAEAEIVKLPRSSGFCFSSIYQTAAIGAKNSPEYLNAIVSFTTALEADELLRYLLTIEANNGRERPHVNSPRTLDLDLIFYGDHIINKDELTVPHPRLQERFFVLTPLKELAPKLKHPIFKKDIQTLEEELAMKLARDNHISKSDKKFLSVF